VQIAGEILAEADAVVRDEDERVGRARKVRRFATPRFAPGT
jgi:hypothetical protein